MWYGWIEWRDFGIDALGIFFERLYGGRITGRSAVLADINFLASNFLGV